jgi:hypothetical protein
VPLVSVKVADVAPARTATEAGVVTLEALLASEIDWLAAGAALRVTVHVAELRAASSKPAGSAAGRLHCNPVSAVAGTTASALVCDAPP